MKEIMRVPQKDLYRNNIQLYRHENGELSAYGGVVNVTFPVNAANIVIWQHSDRTIAELKIQLFCQRSGDRLIAFNVELTITQAQELHQLLPELDYHDEREAAA